MDEWRELPPDDQATYLVGLIARSAVDLDAMTSTVWPNVMQLPPSSAWEAPRPMSQRLTKLRTALPGIDFLKPLELSDALSLIEDVGAIYDLRSRFVHDDLMPQDASHGDWWSAAELHHKDGNNRSPQRRVDLGDLRQCERSLIRATWRVWGLHKLIAGVMAGRADHERHRWHHLMRGSFELHDRDNSVSYATDGPPHPAG